MHLKEVPLQLRPVNLLKGEQKGDDYTRLNPSGFVPGLVIGQDSYGESVAILEWLEETYPAPPLLPVSPADRLKVRQLCHTISSGTQPLQNLAAQRMHADSREEQLNWARYWIERGFKTFEKLSAPVAGTFSFGSSLSIADLCMVPQVYNAKRFGVSMDPFPTINRVAEHCMRLDSCQKTKPENYT